jgi:predicted AlkP superfamily pyrophosphatase or phosphodiesterase
VVLISIAGLRAEHYGAKPSDRAGSGGLWPEGAVMPRLASLAAGGAFADSVVPVMPPAPYPVHASLVTGRRPDQHDVLGDEILTTRGLSLRGLASENRIKVPTLWRAAQASGLAVAALSWPSTLGSSIDLLLPDIGVASLDRTWLEALEGHTTPWLEERLARLEELPPDTAWPDPAVHDSIVRQLACEIARQPTTPELWLLRFQQSGAALAVYGPGTSGAREAFARIDSELDRLIACFASSGLLESTALVVTGDRGLLPVHTLVAPNVALAAVGLITKGPAHEGVEISSWLAVARSHGGSAVVHAVDESSAVLARRALEDLASETGAFRVVSAAELVALHADPQAWFGLAAHPGFVLAKPARGPRLQATELRGRGGFLPTQPGSEVGFVAWGSGVRPGVRIPQMSQLEIGPTVARLLGVELVGAQGRPLIGLLGTPPRRSQGGPG